MALSETQIQKNKEANKAANIKKLREDRANKLKKLREDRANKLRQLQEDRANKLRQLQEDKEVVNKKRGRKVMTKKTSATTTLQKQLKKKNKKDQAKDPELKKLLARAERSAERYSKALHEKKYGTPLPSYRTGEGMPTHVMTKDNRLVFNPDKGSLTMGGKVYPRGVIKKKINKKKAGKIMYGYKKGGKV